MKDIKELTGAVSVNGDVTPTLREKIDQVHPEKWNEMSTTELWEQKAVLLTRISYAQQAGHPELITQIQRGVNTIEQMLTARSLDQDKKFSKLNGMM